MPITPIMDTSMYTQMYDPYFMQAFQAPNINAQIATQAATQTSATESTGNLTFQGGAQSATLKPATDTAAITALADSSASQQIEQTQSENSKKRKRNAKIILGVIGTAAVAGLCIAAHKKGNADLKFLDRMGDGFKEMWNTGKDKVTGAFKKASDKVFTVTKAGEEMVCTIPGQTNKITGDVSKITEELSKIGAKTDAPQVVQTLEDGTSKLADGITLKEIIFKEGGNKFTWNGKEFTAATDANGENILNRILNPTETADVAYKDTVKNLVEKFSKGEGLEQAQKYSFEHVQDGLTRMFTQELGQAAPVITGAESRFFNVNSDTAKAFFTKNPEISKTFESAMKSGDFKDWRVLKAESANETLGGKFVIENGKIAGFRLNDGTFHKAGSEWLLARQHENPEIFENVLKNTENWTNKVYATI